MTPRLDLVLCALLLGTAGSELVAPDAMSAAHPTQTCSANDQRQAAPTRLEAKERILAEGYGEVTLLTRGCDNVWHALAFAEGDPVHVQVTPRGLVLTE